MKKFIFTANVIALLLLVPAILVGYLHSDASANSKTATREIVKEANPTQEDGSLLRLVKSF